MGKKKKWTAVGVVSGSKYLGTFEAETKEQAETMAWENADVSMCHHCSDECEDPEISEIIIDPEEESQ